jgi:putative ABC transport system ATP-binding protein
VASKKEINKPAGPIIRVMDVGKTFREGSSRTDALKNVSFDIMPGEFCTIIGRSGSGKSTLLNMLAGLDHPSRGQIVILGRHIERMNEDELVEFRLRHVGFVFQSYNLFPSYDALENVAMPLTYRGVPRQRRNRRARKMIQAVGLLHRMHHTPNKMSGGEQQRIGIARALVTNPQIIFADEPTGNLDVKTSARALKLMTDCVRERGTTLIVVTHDPEMSRYADRVIRLLDGRVMENSVNPHPEPILPPEDSGQDWAQDGGKPTPKPTPTHRRRAWPFGRRRDDPESPAPAQSPPESETQPDSPAPSAAEHAPEVQPPAAAEGPQAETPPIAAVETAQPPDGEDSAAQETLTDVTGDSAEAPAQDSPPDTAQ